MSGTGNGKNGNGKNGKKKLTPAQLAVLAGLLTNALTVDSVMIDKDKKIEIVLAGSLRKATKMDRLLEEMSAETIGDLLDSIKNM
jgi:hypothetical protein